MLNIYTEERFIPDGMKFVYENDAYFVLISRRIKNDEDTARMLKEIDDAVYQSSSTFIGKFIPDAGLFYTCLSTGCKTALNVHYNPDVCFDLFECGNNAKNSILNLSNGNVLLDSMPLITGVKEISCLVNSKYHINSKSELYKLYKELGYEN